MTLYQIIKAIQDAPKKGGHKLAILQQHKDNELLQAYLKAVYDPRINYYTTKLPKPSEETYAPGMYVMDEEVLKGLNEQICTRAISGKAATKWFAFVLSYMYPEDRELLSYIIKRDINADVGEGTILKVWPDLFFIPPYQRCGKMDDKAKARFAKLPYFYVQTKSDGQFSYLIKRSNGVSESMSRAGSLYPSWLPEMLSQGLPNGLVLAGEMLVYKNGKMLDRKTGNGILNSVLSGDGGKFDPDTMTVQYVAWDLLTEKEFIAGKSARKYEDRLDALQSLIESISSKSITKTASWKVRSIAEAVKIQNEHLARKEEGTVWKEPDLLWRDCSSGDPKMVKAKLVFEADYEIEGAYEGEGKFVGMLGGFNMKTSDGLIKFNVGTGLDDAQRKEYWEAYLQFGNEAFAGRIATIEGNDIITSESKDTESIFLPVFVEIRLDKKVANTRDEVWAEFNAARGL